MDNKKYRVIKHYEDLIFFISVPLMIVVALLFVVGQNFLLFHTLAEFFAIIISIMVGVVAWHTYSFTKNNFLMFLGCGYLWVGIIDLLHTLAYKGMPTMSSASPNLAIQYWLAARGLEATILVLAPFFLSRNLKRGRVFVGFGVASVVMLVCIAFDYFPLGYIDGKGLTNFKVVSEYIIIFVLALAIFHLWKRKHFLDKKVIRLMIAAMLLTMAAELAFTFYVSVFDLSNIVGHIFKLLSYWLIFIAIIDTTLNEPFFMMARGAISFDAVPDATIVVNKKGIIKQANKAACKLSGQNEAELRGQACHDLFHYGVDDECPLCYAINHEKPIESYAAQCSQNFKWFMYTLSQFSDIDGDNETVQVMRDVTSIRLAESELHSAQAQMAELFKEHHAVTRALHDVLYMINNAGELVWWNEVLEKVTGLTSEELMGTAATEFFIDDDKKRIATTIESTFVNGSANVEAMFKTSKGIRPYCFSAVVTKNDDGEIIGISGVGQDVSDRNEAQLALKESEARFQRAVLGSSDGIWDWDIKSGVIYFSDRFKELLGFSLDDDAQGFGNDISAIEDRIHPDDVEPARAARKAHIENGTPYQIEVRLRTLDDLYRWFFIRGQAIWDKNGVVTRVSGSLTDITQRKQDEAELRRHRTHLSELVEGRTTQLAQARDQAMQANQSKSLFLANMSHELRTPLNSIIGFTTIMHEEMAGPINEEQRRQLKMVQDSSHHLLSLINDILDLSKVEAGKTEIIKERIAIRPFIDELIAQMEPLATEKSLELHVDIITSINEIYSDHAKLRQVLTNLLGNAIKFTHAGAVTLRMQIDADQNLIIEVLDTGIGIDKNKIDDIFSAFKQLDEHSNRQYEGTGLGLTISRRFIDLLGGSLEVKSNEGKGSCFTITLPAAVLT